MSTLDRPVLAASPTDCDSGTVSLNWSAPSHPSSAERDPECAGSPLHIPLPVRGPAGPIHDIRAFGRQGTGIRGDSPIHKKKTVPKLKAPIIEAVVEDRSGCIPVVWFGQEYLLKLLPEGTMAFFYGKVEYSGFSRSLVLRSPFSEPLDPDEGMKRSYHIGRIVPVYREEEGISSSVFRRMTGDVLKSLWGETFDPLPPEVRDQAGVMEWFRSIVEIHFPKETDQPMDSLLSPDSPKTTFHL